MYQLDLSLPLYLCRSLLMESSCISPAPAEAAAAAPPPSAPELRREHMFDKVMTPSDVGKLNRLVIPKQHAERFFPLDRSVAVKGLTLAFEDAGGGGGRRWCFRYSYWSSSQSYVITRGWSRFVREKQLSAGDTVSFSRSSPDAASNHRCHRLFIDSQRRWRPRPKPQLYSPSSLSRFSVTCPAWRSPQMDGMQFESRRGAVGMVPTVAVPAVILDGAAKPRQLRLFGVNLECPEPEGGGNSGCRCSPAAENNGVDEVREKEEVKKIKEI